VHELVRYVLDQASTPLVIGIGLVAASVIAVLQRIYSRRFSVLRDEIGSRDDRLAELERTLYLSKVNELQAKLVTLNPQPRRRLSVRQKALLAEHARVPEDRRFSIEIIHDMAGSDCSAYANDFQILLNEIGGWSISRSAVLGPGWVARCGLGVHVQSREILSRPETIMLNALAAAGIDYDLVRIPEFDADIGLLVTPAPAKRLQPVAVKGNGFSHTPEPQATALDISQAV
jgi:hypothetical protein